MRPSVPLWPEGRLFLVMDNRAGKNAGYNGGMRSAWKVGALVVIFGVLVMGVFATLRASLFAPPMSEYHVRFEDAGGLTTGSPVLLAGVPIGDVKEVKLGPDGKARVILAIDPGTTIAKGTTAVLPSSFIAIGDRQVLLQGGDPSKGTYAANNESDPIPGVLQGPLDSVFPDSEKTMEELNKTMIAFQNLLNDEELKAGLVGVMKAGEQTAGDFGKLASNLDGTLTRNSARIDSLMKTMVVTMQNFQEVSAEVAKFAKSGELQKQTEELMTTMNSAAKEGELLVKDLRSYTSDPALKASLTDTMSNFETMSDSGVKIAADAEVMAKNGVEISKQTAELMTKANKLADEVAKLIDEFKGTVDRLVPSGGKGLIPEVGIEADLTRVQESDRLRADVTAVIPAGKEKVVFGLYDAFESNKLTFQLERALNPKTDLRYGVYASKPGVGVSYQVAPNLRLRSDVFGLNDPQMDLRLRYDFPQGFHGWVGIEKVFGKNSPSIGIGVKK